MDSIAHRIKERQQFTGEVLHLMTKQPTAIDLYRAVEGKWKRKYGMWYQEGTSLEEAARHEIPDAGYHLIPLDPTQQYQFRTRLGHFDAFVVEDDPTYQPKKITQPRPSYDVLGNITFWGAEGKIIGPLHLPGVIGGRIVVQILAATRIDEENFRGRFVIESSDDGDKWFELNNRGLVDGPLEINQRGLHTGDEFHGDFNLTNHGEYLRIRYQPIKIVGEGFQVSCTVETKCV